MKNHHRLAQAYGLYKSSPTQGTSARTASGAVTFPQSDDACSFCSVGALAKVCEDMWDRGGELSSKYLNTAAHEVADKYDLDMRVNPHLVFPAIINDYFPKHVDEMWLIAIEMAKQDSECAL